VVFPGALSARTAHASYDASSQLSLPWAKNTTWYWNGPHNWADVSGLPWNSLDLNGSGGTSYPVVAARAGYAHLDGKAASCGYVRVDHGDGWSTTYIHLSSLSVADLTWVTRGTQLGYTGTNVSCFGTATANHVHFSIWYVPSGQSFCLPVGSCPSQEVAWNSPGIQIEFGNYVWTNGSQQYYGCATNILTNASTCFSNYLTNPMYNDAAIGGCGTNSTTVADGLQGDLTGDGRTDFVSVNDDSAWAMTSTGSQFNNPVAWLSTNGAPCPYGTRATMLGDVNGDGKADLVTVNEGNTYVWLSNGTGFSAPLLWAGAAFYGTRATLLADMNGDGKADLVAVNDGSVWVMLSTGSGFGTSTQWSSTPFYGSLTTLLGDMTGDHKGDLVAINGTSVWLMPSTGSGFGSPAQWSPSAFYGTRATVVGDINNDGKFDLVAVNENSVWAMLSNGTGFGTSTQWLLTSSPPPYGTRATLLGSEIVPHWADLVAINDGNTYVMASGSGSFGAPTPWSNLAFYGTRATI
jgi:murein DD-endopeptidase MepM/ murein hydrolase activator NlpD